jgi:uncharacterized protein (TIGR02231 family)
VKLKAGSHQLVVDRLPVVLETASVRASARGTTPARLLGVDVRREFYAETPAERVSELEKAVEGAEDEIAGLDSRMAVLEQERESIRGLSEASETFAKGLGFGKTTPSDLLALLDSLRQRAEEVGESALSLAAERRELDRQLQKLRRELEQLRGARQKERYSAVVEVEVEKGGDLSLELTYVVSRAGWRPQYDLRLGEAEESVLEVSYLAQVAQNTGEDWENVELTLSTARPALTETIPELEPWYVGPVRAAPAPTARRAKMVAAAPAPQVHSFAAGAAQEATVAAEEVEAAYATAEVETQGTTVTYRVPGDVSIPADGSPHKVAVAQISLLPNLDYVCAPKMVEAAYRRAKILNDSSYTLLPGAASIFVGEEYIGSSRLELAVPQGELELYLGVEDRLKVERELVRKDVDKKMIGDRRRRHYGYEITIENLLSGDVTFTLQDQIPVSTHEAIKVRLESVQPQPTEQSDLGIMDWELTLDAGEKTTIKFVFVIEHPRHMSVLRLPA